MIHKLFKTKKIEEKIAYIIRDSDKNQLKWIIVNINGWKATSFCDENPIFNISCYKNKIGKNIIWTISNTQGSIFRIFISKNKYVEVMERKLNMSERIIDVDLTVDKYHLIKSKNYNINDNVLVHNSKYKNIIGKFKKKHNKKNIIRITPKLIYLASDTYTENIATKSSHCYKMVPYDK